jgi:hypothetical protein
MVNNRNKTFMPKIKPIIYSLIIGLMASNLVVAQQKIDINLKNSTYISSADSLPFWFWANQFGTVQPQSQLLNLTSLSISNLQTKEESGKLAINWGATAIGGWGTTNYLQLNEAYAGLAYWGWQLDAGLFRDKDAYNGLSTTNGNVARSLNARPYPKIRLSTLGYQPVPLIGKWLRFKAEYDEGLLNDERYVNKAHMHHKSLYFSLPFEKSWKINLGLEHFVMWGGVSKDPRYADLPDSFSAYILYITGSSGSADFPTGEQINVAGNQVGSYQAQVSKVFDQFEVEAYASHWFEDHSGMVLRNWQDNLLGLKIDFKQKDQFLSTFVYEFMNTRNQSVVDSFYKWNEAAQKWDAMENDQYFYHYIYKSGFTYHKQMMSSPLFRPKFAADGQTMTIPSNRFYTHHFGLMGNLSKQLQWKGLFTYTHHFGTYLKPFEPTQKAYSLLLDLNYCSPKIPFNIGLSTAADLGTFYGNKLGVQLSLSKTW